MKKVIICGLICTFLLFSLSAAFGFVLGSSNFGITGYPEFVSKHFRPSKPYSRDSYSLDRYTSNVKGYVKDIVDYVEAANNDIERIQESIKKASQEAEETIDEHNRFIKNGY